MFLSTPSGEPATPQEGNFRTNAQSITPNHPYFML
jgi:hypothetical protein